MAEAVLFDMDGVLVQTEWFYHQRRAAFLGEHGRSLPPGFDATGSNEQAIWQELVPEDGVLRERLRAAYLTYAKEHPVPWPDLLTPGVKETLFGLRERGIKTAICSSSRRSFVEDFVRTVGLGRALDALVAGDDGMRPKPSPEPYIRAAQALGVRPAQAIVVEDSPTGIRAGKAAGAFVCALRQPDGVLLDQREADLVIGALPDLLALVERPRPVRSV